MAKTGLEMSKAFSSFIAFIYNITNCFPQGKYPQTIKVTDNTYAFKPEIDRAHGNGVAVIIKKGILFSDKYEKTTYAAENSGD